MNQQNPLEVLKVQGQLFTKVLRVLSEVKKIEKSGFNKHQNYHYSTEQDLIGAVKQLLIDNKIIILTDSLAVHGKTIMIDHGHNVVSVFNHLDSILVKEGAFVRKGTQVATMGNTGNSTGPHLHWGLSVNNVRVNPLPWVEKKLAPNYF